MAIENWTIPTLVYSSGHPRPATGDTDKLYVNSDTGTQEDLSDADMYEWNGSVYVSFTGHRPHRPPQQ